MNNNFPPLMSDGRNFSNWEQPISMDTFLQTSNNIKSNWEYRKYLANNADSIIKLNQQQAVNSSTYPIDNQMIPLNYLNSDLILVIISTVLPSKKVVSLSKRSMPFVPIVVIDSNPV